MKKLIYILLILICLFLLVYNVSMPGSGSPYHDLQNYTHVLLFLLITLAIYSLLPQRNRRILHTGFVAAGFAFATEAGQYYTRRDADFYDIFLNFIGVGISLLWLSFRSSETVRRKRRIVIGLVFLIIIPVAAFFVETGEVLQLQHRFANMLPVLADFEDDWDMVRWQSNGGTTIQRSSQYAMNGQFSLKVRFDTSGYPGVILSNFVRDWSDYTGFSFEVYNPNHQTIRLFIRFDDARSMDYGTRGHAKILLKPGENRIRLPVARIIESPRDRNLNIKQMATVIFFLHHPEKEYTLYVDDVKFR